MSRPRRDMDPYEQADSVSASLSDAEIARVEFERLVAHRPEHAATPLNSYSLTESGTPYIRHAIGYVNDTLANNLNALSAMPPKPVVELLETSVNAALFSRVHENNNKTIPIDTDEETADIFAKACKGFANPEELLVLLSRHPEHLHSLELAKLTHPFDWRATSAMDIQIDDVLTDMRFIKRGSSKTQNPRYYYMRSDDPTSPQAMILIRKADIGMRGVPEGAITVVQRDSLVIDLTHKTMASGGIDKEVRRWLTADETRSVMRKNDAPVRYARSRLVSFIEDQLETGEERRSRALYPGVRSYYARFDATPTSQG